MNRSFKLATLGLALCLPFSVQAHRAWILPASTVLSSDDPWVTFDAAVSNDIFHTDYRPLQVSAVTALAPDGSGVLLRNVNSGKLRATFDLQLQQKGTYKVFTASNGLSASWVENGKPQRWPARGATPKPGEFATAVPKQAENLVVMQSSRRVETFVTAGSPSKEVLAPSNVGFELVPITHPNDLFVGEAAQFRFLIDGQPAVGAEVTVLPDGMRYRNGQEAMELVSDKDGLVSIVWPRAGQYFLEAEYKDDQGVKPATQRRGGYVATFEVLPQ